MIQSRKRPVITRALPKVPSSNANKPIVTLIGDSTTVHAITVIDELIAVLQEHAA